MIQIVEASPEDASEILAYMKVCGAETDNLSFDGEGISLSVEQEAAFIDSIKQSTNNLYLLARDGDEIVGAANYSVSSKERLAHQGTIGISVRKSHWNQGIASQLLEKILLFAKNEANSDVVSLDVRSDNQAAIHLYEKFGFTKIGTFKGYFKIHRELIDVDMMHLIL